jgi:hypothetical protein
MKRHQMFELLAITFIGCNPYTLEPSASKMPTPKPEDCTFEVSASMPAGKYEEIATLTCAAEESIGSPSRFQKKVQADVCKVGGDVVVTEINGRGGIIRGVVFRRLGP